MKTLLLLAASLALASAYAACGGKSSVRDEATPVGMPSPADFQARVDNPFFPLTPGSRMVYEGAEADVEGGTPTQVRVESTVLSETEVIAGVEVTIVEVNDYEDDELVEHTRDYYAQHKDGTVYYFGERIDEYEGGKIVGHSGEWLAGDNGNMPGIYVPAEPKTGVEFQQEGAKGVAEDRGTVLATDQTVQTPAGSFSGCIKIDEFDPLENFSVINFFCRGVGLVHEEPPEGSIDLIDRT